eukprot:6216717-Alexandrium_andersonii.AAC.1
MFTSQHSVNKYMCFQATLMPPQVAHNFQQLLGTKGNNKDTHTTRSSYTYIYIRIRLMPGGQPSRPVPAF